MKQPLTKKKLFWQITLALVVMIAVMVVCSLIGTHRVSLKSVFAAVFQANKINPDYEIFMQLRLPRIILAGIVGAALDRKSTRLNSSH
jgi:ABC-type Fe3+-siderophore transport system permease subunit